MIRPSRSSVVLSLCLAGGAGLCLVLAWAGIITPTLASQAGFGLLAATCIMLAFDALTTLGIAGRAGLRATANAPGALPVGVRSALPIVLDRHNPERAAATNVEVHLFLQPTMPVDDCPAVVDIPPRQQATVTTHIKPTERGDLRVDSVQLWHRSKFGLWRRRETIAMGTIISIFPNFSRLRQYELLAARQASMQMGIRTRRRRGEGQSFHQLRDYRDGDMLRQVDWKASARHRRLISREYAEERDQRVIFLLDCGRHMRAREAVNLGHDPNSGPGDGPRDDSGDGLNPGLASEPLSHFDHALDAMMLLANIALTQGDSVGLHCCGGVERWRPARKGMHVVNQLMSAVYDLQPTTHVADFVEAAEQLARRETRRSLIVILTNTRDEDVDDLRKSVAVLAQRHLVLVANLREQALEDAINDIPDSFEEAVQQASILDYMDSMARRFEQLSQLGALQVMTTPAQLPPALVNRYLEVKRRGAL